MEFDFSKYVTGEIAKTQTQPVTTKQPEVINVQPKSEAVAKPIITAPLAKVDNIEDYFKLDPTTMDRRITDTVNALNDIEIELNNEFVERENEIRMVMLAVIAGVNAFFHGPAGTAKSNLIEEFARRITRSEYFRVLLGKATEPGEIFGPVSIAAMKNDKFKFNTAGHLPEAHIAFVDETFKCNSAVLNSFLTIMNEKLFFNDGPQEVPLISMIGASNEYPEDDSLVALYDRFLLKWHVEYIQDENNRMKLFQNFLSKRKGKSKFQQAALTANYTTIDLVDLLALNEKVKDVDISNKVLKEYNRLFITLGKDGIYVSDRRKNEALKVVQAQALLDGRDYVDTNDFEALKYCLWNEQKDIQKISDHLVKLANPNITKYNQYKASLQKYRDTLAKIEEDKSSTEYEFNRSITLTETNKNLKFAVDTIEQLIPTLNVQSKEYTKFQELLKDMKKFLDEVRQQIVV
jgi:MoxR-like ATPase